MPKNPEECRKGSAEEPLPEQKPRSKPHRVAHPQIPSADAEKGKEPAYQQLKADDRLAQQGEPSVKGSKKIHGRAQGHTAEKAAQESAPDQARRHRSSPRFRRGSW